MQLLDSGEVLESTEKTNKSKRKPLPATYEPGTSLDYLSAICEEHTFDFIDKRTSAWLKLKKDYVIGLGDSLDLVPIGAWHGNGRKAQWWSPVLLAVWDSDLGKLVAMCKCMSGEQSHRRRGRVLARLTRMNRVYRCFLQGMEVSTTS